jgi:hypothetical protein
MEVRMMHQKLFAVVLILVLAPILYGQEFQNQAFVAKTLSPLSASLNKKGDRFSLQVVTPETYKDALIEAEVVTAKASGKVSGKSELLFAFDRLVLKDGTVIPITADLTGIQNSKGVANVDEEGHAIGKSSKKKDIMRAALLTGIGAAIGGVAGGGGGAAKGAAIGAALGLTIAFSTRGPDIKIDPGSIVQLTVSTQKK